jgi:hypothetical protein
MVPSSTITVTADGECSSHDDLSLGETICFGSLKFITDCFSILNLSPWRDSSDATAMGSTHCEPPSPLRATTGDSTEEFHMASNREGGAHPPLSSKARHRGFAHPHHNHVMVGECPDHSGDDDDTTVANGTMASLRPPFRAMMHSLGRETSTSSCSVTLRRAGDSATM